MDQDLESVPPLHHPVAMLGRLLSLPLVALVLTVYVLLADLW